MILNNKDIIKIIKPDKHYFIGSDFIENLIKIKDIYFVKVDCKENLNVYIDNSITYLNAVKVHCETLLQNQLVNFSNYKKNIIRKITIKDEFINVKLYTKIPNNNYKIIPTDTDLLGKYNLYKWNKNVNINSLSNINSYKKIIICLTKNLAKSYKDIYNMKLYDKKEINNKNDVLEFVNSLTFPKETMDMLIGFLEQSKNYLKIMKTNDINSLDTDPKEAAFIAFKNIEGFIAYCKNIIRILTEIYRTKISLIYGGVSKNYNNLINISEMLNTDFSQLYQSDIFFSNGMNIDEILNNDITCKKEYNDNIAEYINNYIDNMYTNCSDNIKKHSIEKYKYISYYDFNSNNINDLSMSIEDIINLKDKDQIIKYISDSCNIKIEINKDIYIADNDIINGNYDFINCSLNRDYNYLKYLINNYFNNINESININESYCSLLNKPFNQIGLDIELMLEEYSKEDLNKYRNTIKSKSKYYKEIYEENNGYYKRLNEDKIKLLFTITSFTNRYYKLV